MALLRLGLITVICFGLTYSLGREIVLGITTGKIAYSKLRLQCHRTSNPAGFWSLVALFSLLALAFLLAWALLARPLFRMSLPTP